VTENSKTFHLLYHNYTAVYSAVRQRNKQ